MERVKPEVIGRLHGSRPDGEFAMRTGFEPAVTSVDEHPLRFADRAEARDFLRGFIGDAVSMAVLRRLVDRPAGAVWRLSDLEVLDRLAIDLAGGRIRVSR